MKKELLTNLKDLPILAQIIAKNLKGGETFALNGPLGSGKTTFVKALGKELKIKKTITSPTFAIINKYSFRLKGKIKYLYHLDLYRTETIKEISSLGLEEFLGQSNCITFIEWANKAKSILPKSTIEINFTANEK